MVEYKRKRMNTSDGSVRHYYVAVYRDGSSKRVSRECYLRNRVGGGNANETKRRRPSENVPQRKERIRHGNGNGNGNKGNGNKGNRKRTRRPESRPENK